MIRMLTIVAVLAPFLAAANAQAQAFVPDLAPGSIYHLAFVTNALGPDGPGDATSDQISDYDALVNANADANPDLAGINWLALGSTPTVDAIDHVPISGPIYRLDGELLANDQADLWDGDLLAPLNVSPAFPGFTLLSDLVWTGSYLDGTAHPCSLGGPYEVCWQGISIPPPYPASAAWSDPLEHGKVAFGHPVRLNQASRTLFYAMSEPLSVPIPEPSGLALLLLGSCACLGWHHRRSRCQL